MHFTEGFITTQSDLSHRSKRQKVEILLDFKRPLIFIQTNANLSVSETANKQFVIKHR